MYHAEFRSKRVISLDIKWNSASPDSKVATLQLCHESRCIIIQLLHLDLIPNSLRNLLSDRSITFVGVGITQDIAKLDRDYGFKCWAGNELGALSNRFFGRPKVTQLNCGAEFASTMHKLFELPVGKPVNVARSDWSRNILGIEQIKYAAIDAYVYFQYGEHLCQLLRLRGENI
ncbi:Werner Syndrome-like exonuclease [Papaver somniferum]|uniref:Werner Syndrome-like exonuclease n=1 Tax=Papaver somniferum TaxID=3469 RepID=UPI000E6F5B9B|nr:Werner Syndrome-like exonuclease [Papaver somniferum]